MPKRPKFRNFLPVRPVLGQNKSLGEIKGVSKLEPILLKSTPMNIKSFYSERQKLKPLEVELSLQSGLPGIIFLGLADTSVKESAYRIKSAIKNSGYEFPSSQTVLVNLRPHHLRKNSRGLELAVAMGILWLTRQAEPLVDLDHTFIYGELSLSGSITKPNDLETHLIENDFVILTGPSHATSKHELLCLNSLTGTPVPFAPTATYCQQRPNCFEQVLFSDQQKKLIEIISVGHHSTLLAGPSGSGKSFLAKSILSFLKPLKPDEVQQISENMLIPKESITWRPVVAPHHSIPPAAFLGGGSQNFMGEVAKAHKGLLILDELLEFKPAILESLREILEASQFTVSRSGFSKTYPVELIALATTNLCPCGSFTPVKKPLHCRFSLTKCRSYLQRLSGPLNDRFQVLYYTHELSKLKHSGREILCKVEKAQVFKETLQNKFTWDFLANKMLESWSFSSNRRRQATQQVAQTLALLDFSAEVKLPHVEEAMQFTVRNFDRLNDH